MSKVKLSLVFYGLILALLAGCDFPVPSATPTSVSIADQGGNGPITQGDIGDLSIATPPGTDFWLLSAEYLKCSSKKYIVAKVLNGGGMPFSWGEITIWGSMQDFAQSDTPFYQNPNECPTQEGADKLAPGKTAYLFAELVHNSPVEVFKVVVELCIEPYWDGCVEREIPFELGLLIDPSKIILVKEVLCWIGPGPMYGVVRTMKTGETVEIVARSQVEGYVVVQDTKYQVFCYLKDTEVDIPEDMDLSALPVITPPPLPTSTPTPTTVPTTRIQFQPRVTTPTPTRIPPPK